MQRCPKFQFLSNTLGRKIIFIICLIGLFLIPSQVYAASLSTIGNASEEEKQSMLSEILEIPIENQKMEIEIGKDGNVLVRHIIWGSSWLEHDPKMIKVLPGTHSNLQVTDQDGDLYPYTYDRETFEESEYVILQTKLSGYDLIVEYDLENFLELKDNVWTKQIRILTDVKMLFDEDVELIFVNSRPIDVSVADGINCIGCEMKLEIINDEKEIIQKISVNGNEEIVNVTSNGNISNFEFNQEINEIYFQTEKNNQLVVLEIPRNVLLYPYEVYQTQNNDDVLDQIDKIRKTEFAHNEKTGKISFRANDSGNISIIGATQEKHDEVWSKMEQQRIDREERENALFAEKELKEREKELKEIEKEREKELKEIDTREVFSEWGENKSNTEDNTLIFVIAGIIAAIVIGAIVIKLKK